jgi:hypothetical protein
MTRAVHLGELLSLGQSSSASLRAWLQAENGSLVHRLEAEAEARGETLVQFLRIAASDFLAEADEETWASLVSTIRDAPDPGAACVACVAGFRLRLESAS